MSVKLILECSGCYDKTVTVGPLRKRFHGSHGDWGLGTWRLDDPEALTPAGWVMFDPWTQCTYCPECWAQIIAEPESDGAANHAVPATGGSN